MKKRIRYISIFFFILTAFKSYSQNKRFISLTKYTQKDGLSSYYITKILKDHYGFIWVGTQEGLNVFDGHFFESFSRQQKLARRLGSSFVEDIVEDKKHDILWVLTSYGDVCGISLQTHQITERIASDAGGVSLSQYWLQSLCLSGDTLWVGGLNCLFAYNIPSKSYISLVPSASLPDISGQNVSQLVSDHYGRTWLFCDEYGIFILQKGKPYQFISKKVLQAVTTPNRILRFWEIQCDSNDCYAATSWGIRHFSIDRRSTRFNAPGHNIRDTSEIFSIAKSPGGNFVYATTGHLYSSDQNQNVHRFQDENSDDEGWLAVVKSLFYDPDTQKIYVGTQSGLCTIPTGTPPFRKFYRSSINNERLRHLYSILPVADSIVYGGDENGLYRVDVKTRAIRKIGNHASNYLVFRDSRGIVFVSNKDGLFVLKKDQLLPAYTLFSCLQPLSGDQLSSAIQFNDSIILFGSVVRKGISVWNTHTNKLQERKDEDSSKGGHGQEVINGLFKSSAGSVFILTGKAVKRFDPLSYGASSMDMLKFEVEQPYKNFMDMCEIPGGYCIATYGGGLLFTDLNLQVHRLFTTTEGLTNDCVYKVFAWRNQFLVATTNNGLTVIDLHTMKASAYFESDGLQSNFFEQECGYQTREYIYAGGVNGFTIIDPQLLLTSTPIPTLFIKKIEIQAGKKSFDTTNLTIADLAIPNTVQQVTISLAGINDFNPLRTRYAYRIGGGAIPWIDLGTRNFVTLPAMEPKKYSIEFRAAAGNSGWGNPRTVAMDFEPNWYQTIYFNLLLGVLFATAIYGIYVYRIRQIKKQQQIRHSIASDLHDDMGSLLHSMKVFTHLARREPGNEFHLQHVEASIVQASVGLRDMIWVLDNEADNLQGLFERVAKIMGPVTHAAGIKLEFMIPEKSSVTSLTKAEKRNLLLIIKEAINNSVKYASCSVIDLSYFNEGKRLFIQIADNGCGYDANKIIAGNGIRNIKERAAQIRFSCEIFAAEGEGTSIILSR